MNALLADTPKLPPYDLGPEHPFARDRQQPLFDLIDSCGLRCDEDRLSSEAASRTELETVHDTGYIELLLALEGPHDSDLMHRAYLHGLGPGDNPIHPGQHQGAAAIAGASLSAVRAILAGRCQAAFQPAGGLHHAMPRKASGFCIYNDVAIAIREAQRLGVERIAYIDYDVHHGDGVEHVFADDPSVLTISFHESPSVRWPFTGKIEDRGGELAPGTAINLPFAPGTGDASWQRCVEEVLDEALGRFQPRLLVTQHGCDPHRSDPLATMELGTGSFLFAAEISKRLAAEHSDGRWLATGGGGYRPFTVLPRAWTMVWAVMSGRELPVHTDPGWRQRWRDAAGEEMPELFVDPPLESVAQERAESENRRCLEELRKVHGW